ncbi:MAG: enoyl-CoA hydratase/isomerase family protein [Deltaproteobacteria bacterium]|nr:MAG: enoyl-CoA hydratase/isomerase family protein [Deltaproteobacteria bacterium]
MARAPVNEIGTTTLAELEALVAALRDGADAGTVRAMILHSALDSGFCAGADLRELYHGVVARRGDGVDEAAIAAEVRSFIDRIHAVMDGIDQAPVTTIAATHGVVFGGGFELALTCDLIVADKSTRFAFPELRLGLVPGFGGIPRLEREVGNAVVRDLLLTGRTLSATRAHELGLVSQLVARGEALHVARHVARQACRFDGATTRAAKAFIKPLPRARLDREKDLFCELFASPVVTEALRRFTESQDARPYLP